MLPEQLWAVIRRAWALVVVIVMVCVVGFVGLAAKQSRPFHSSIKLNVQAPKQTGSSVVNTQLLTVAVPVIAAVLTTDQTRQAILKDTTQYAGSFSLSVSIETSTTLIDVTLSSLNQDLVVPALTSLYKTIAAYPAQDNLPVVVTEPQAPAPVPATRDSFTKKAVLAAIEGIVFGAALAVFAALLVAQYVRRRDQLSRLQEDAGLTTLVTLPDPTEPGAGREDEFVLLAAKLRTEVLSGRAASIAVVSPKSSATRSVVAAQLARGLAVAGHRVLLVDADLRAPRLESALASIDASPIAPFSGMSWLPTETTTVPNLVLLRGTALPRVLDHLDIRGTGPVRLVTGAIASLVVEARNAGAILVVDCPSPDTAAEAAAVLSAVDTAVVVSSGPLRRADRERLVTQTRTVTGLGTDVAGLVVGPKKDYNLRPVPTRSPV